MAFAARFQLALALTLALGSVVVAALPTFWTLENQADFLAGEVEGLSIASDGALTLAPGTANLYEPTDPFIWSLTSDRQGNLFAGSGNEGRIFKLTPSGESTVFADTNELSVYALVVDREGNLYAGTSPQGRVYKFDARGSSSVFFDPDDRYIWALAVDESGNLYVATGENGRLYRVKRNGEGEVVFESRETHLMCLIVDSSGNLYAGSDSNGLIFKIDRSGKVSVLFDSPFQEIHALVVDARGTVYAAAINGEKGAAPVTPTAPTLIPPPAEPGPALPAGGESVTVTVSAAPFLPSAQAAATPSGPARGAVYRVSPEGVTEALWTSTEDTPLSLKLERDDRLMVGTGKAGRIFLVRQDKTSSLLLKAEADQVTAIHGAERGRVYFATSNPARIALVSAERRLEGTYRSAIKDTQTVSTWGKIRWEAQAPSGTGMVLQTRSGNSAKPDNTWSDWSASYTLPEGDQVQSPRGRFLQWRAILKSKSGEVTPELRSVTAVYLQQNLRPEVTEITVHPPGETYQKPLLTTGQVEILGLETPLQSNETDPFGLSLGGPPGASGGATPAGRRPSMPLTAYSKKIQNKGYQTVSWSATDPNDDTLSYEVYYRAEGESLWKLLRRDLREPIIAWDTVAMPDGRYTLKVTASDAPSNPQAVAATGEKESRSFEIDNTPPRVGELKITAVEGGWQVRFLALDDSSAVRSVEYAIDSGRWNVVYPDDGIADSKREVVDLRISAQGNAVRTLVIRITDRLGNVGTARGELRP
jgi:hypothetical protein